MDTSNWIKPWSREQCKQRYVYGSSISIRQMVVESGRGKSTIERWRELDGWLDEKRHYEDNLRTQTQKKLVEKTSEILSDDLARLSSKSVEIHKFFEDFAYQIARAKKDLFEQMMATAASPEEIALAIKTIDGYDSNFWSHMASRATNSLCQVTGLPYYTNINASMKRLMQEGFSISDNEDDN